MKTLFKFMTLTVATLFMACGSSTSGTGTTGNSSTTRNTTPTTTTSGTVMRDNPTTTTTRRDDASTTTTRRNDNTTNTGTVSTIGNGNREQSINNTNPTKVAPVNQVDYDMQRTKQMYTSLNMTDDQITRYETASRASMDSWKMSNAERAMTAQQRLDQQDTTIKSILDAPQYQNYQQWVRDNPYRN